MRTALLLASISLFACGRSAGPWQLTPITSSAGSGSGTTSVGDVGDSADADTAETAESADTADGWGEETGGFMCEPVSDVSADFGVEIPVPFINSIELNCVVLGAFHGWTESQFDFDCRLGGMQVPAFVFLQHGFGAEPMLFPDMSVNLLYARADGFEYGEWFAIHGERGLIVGGMRGGDLWPPFASAIDWSPLQVGLFGDACEAQDDDCGVFQRVGINAWFDKTEAIVFDGNVGYVGQQSSFAVAVQSAREYLEIWCDDFPQRYVQALFVAIPEG